MYNIRNYTGVVEQTPPFFFCKEALSPCRFAGGRRQLQKEQDTPLFNQFPSLWGRVREGSAHAICVVGKFLLTSMLLAFVFTQPLQAQEGLQVTLVTIPSADEIGPDDTLATTTISIVDGTGQPVPNAYLQMHLDAPKGNAFISTDFPIVEGTPLFEFEGLLPDGRLEFDYIYPIRGTYAFEVRAGMSADTLNTAENTTDTLSLTIRENASEVWNFAIFAAFLLLFGLIAGYIIGGNARPQPVALGALSILFWGIVVGLFAENPSVVSAHNAAHSAAHGGDTPSNTDPFVEELSQNGLTLRYAMDAGAGRVGTLNAFDFTLTGANDALVPDATFSVDLWHIEDDKPLFSMRLPAPTGTSHMMFQFFDGAEHEVRLEASSPQGNVKLARLVEVEAIDPPLFTKLKTTIYLVFFTFLGILIGLRVRFRQLRRQQFAAAT